MAENPILFDALRYLGGAYLIWRGIVLIRHSGPNQVDARSSASAGSAIQEGLIASLINPKGHVFLLAFLPQFVRPEDGYVALQFVILGIIMRVVALIVEGGIAFFAGSIGRRLREHERLQVWLERGAGGLLIAVGLRLVLVSRPEDALLRR